MAERKTMDINKIIQRYNERVEAGKNALEAASNYLSEHCGDWSSSHELCWLQLIHQSEIHMTAACTLAELIKEANRENLG